MIFAINLVVSILQGIVMAALLCLLWMNRNYIKALFEDGYEEPEKHRGFEPVVGAPADTILPVRGSDNAAGYDFYAPEDIVIPAHGKSELVFFNVKAFMEPDEWLYMRIRSGLGTKHEIMLETSGVIDSDYYGNPTTDGNIATVFRNHGDEPFTIRKGERCCQGIFLNYLVADNDKTLGARRGGYGSTGNK